MTEQQIRVNPKLAIERLKKAFNDHNVEALTESIDPFYIGEEPVHPDRALRGREKIRAQWSEIFRRVPGFRAEIIASATEGDTVWVEWHWTGRQADGGKLDMRGVTISGIKDNRFVWGRVYMEPVQAPGPGLQAVAER